MSSYVTKADVLLLSFLGAALALLGAIVLGLLTLAVYTAVQRISDQLELVRARRRDLATCRAINRLPTTDTRGEDR